MIEIIYGKTKSPLIVDQLFESLQKKKLEGTLYIGYPILASAEEPIAIDALLVCNEHGLIVFDFFKSETYPTKFDDWNSIQDKQDVLYYSVKNNLGRHQNLRVKRDLGVEINILTLFPEEPEFPESFEIHIATPDTAPKVISVFPPLDERFIKPLNAALQRVTTIKPIKKRAAIKTHDSKGAILKSIEKEIANLDQWQKRAAIETPDGPQRIRGLAGSGKTVVLALKAAYLHTQNPDWTIALTFQTRSLYQQFTDLVRRFAFEHSGDEPDWDRLKILHAWGGSWKGGIYTEIAEHCGVTIRDFLYAKSKYGMDRAFHGICRELLTATEKIEKEPLYDVTLIDEAQDLPWPFFHLIYKFTAEPKRIIWAYDELQNLSETIMPPVSALFGTNRDGTSKVSLANIAGQPRQDLILPVCYRNTPWALTLAHALGFGIYRKEGLVQHFDEPGLWQEIGYYVSEGNLELGKEVILGRNKNSYPAYFEELIDENEAIVSKMFTDTDEQAEWVAAEIEANLNQDELDYDDILIVLPSAIRAKKDYAGIMNALQRRNIDTHLAGVTTSQDEIFSHNSVAVTNIFRAKGNEAPMVYVMNCGFCASGYELIKLRNILFTAITRSRGWVRLCGFGNSMNVISKEIMLVKENAFKLKFKIPTAPELEKLRKIHRDRTAGEKAAIKKAEKGLENFLSAVLDGKMALENVPEDLRKKLETLIVKYRNSDEDI